MNLFIILFVGVIAVSFASIFIKLCDAPAMVIATYRLGLASVFFLAIAGVKGLNPFKTFTRRDLLLAGLAGVFLSLHFATWITSLKYTSVAISVVLLSTSPVFVALGSILFLKEKPARLLFAGIALTVLGCIVMISTDLDVGENSVWGSILASLGAISAAGYYLVGRRLRTRIDTVSYVAVVYSITFVVLACVTFLFNHPFFGYDAKIYGLFFLIAFVPQVIGHTCFNWALEHLTAVAVAVTALGEPIGATLLAFFILGEKITVVQAIGCVLILAGVALALKIEKSANVIRET